MIPTVVGSVSNLWTAELWSTENKIHLDPFSLSAGKTSICFELYLIFASCASLSLSVEELPEHACSKIQPQAKKKKKNQTEQVSVFLKLKNFPTTGTLPHLLTR